MNNARILSNKKYLGMIDYIDENTQDDYEVVRMEFSTREILELRRQGMNISEIAAAIGCSKCTVWNRLKLVNLKEEIPLE